MKTPEERAEEWARRKKIIYMREYRVKNRERISRWSKDYYRRKQEEKKEDEARLRRIIGEMGWKLLENEWIDIEREDGRLTLIETLLSHLVLTQLS